MSSSFTLIPVWKAPNVTHPDIILQEKKIVLRISRKTSPLQPYRLRNEVACLQYLAAKVPSIPAPKVYAWDDGSSSVSGPAFIVEEFIEGQPLNAVWPQLTENEKATITWEIANVLVDLGETRFHVIGGLALDAIAGPTIEAAKVFHGRVSAVKAKLEGSKMPFAISQKLRAPSRAKSSPQPSPKIPLLFYHGIGAPSSHSLTNNPLWQQAKFHSPHHYNIGPYPNSKVYILACYDREIYYYTHAPASDFPHDIFETTSAAAFAAHLQRERTTLASQPPSFFAQIDSEPRVLVHEDFHAGNMLVRDGHLAGVVDWEFSGTYPLSELLGSIAILQISGLREPAERVDDAERVKWDNESIEQEEDRWHSHYLDAVDRVVRQRGWRDEHVRALRGGGHRVLHQARSVMSPQEGRTEDG